MANFIIIGAILLYCGWIIYRSFSKKNKSNASGCTSCAGCQFSNSCSIDK